MMAALRLVRQTWKLWRELPVGARRWAQAGILGYLLGTIPTADIVARRLTGGALDLRTVGSGNPGATNAAAQLGPQAGAVVLAGDIAKSAAAAVVARRLAGPQAAHLGGTAAVIGHCYPIWNRFRGGKGVAASVGQCLTTFPVYFPIDIAVAVGTAAVPSLKQRAFVATTVSSAIWTLGGVVWWRRGFNNAWGPTPTAALPIANAVSSAVIFSRFMLGARR